MGIFDRFKSKEKLEKEPAEKNEKPKAARLPARQVQPEKLQRSPMAKSESRSRSASEKKPKRGAKTGKIVKKEENIAYEILLEPLVSEKSAGLGQFNKYVFKVHPKASKFQIKSAVESYYGVGVTKVNIIKIRPKKRIHGRKVGWKQGFKKAVVTLQQGDTITAVEGV